MHAPPGSPAARPLPVAAATIPESAIQVAVLDDAMDLAQSIALVLTKRGMKAHPFDNADDLAHALSAQHFDAFVLDWLLGTRTAANLILRLRQSPVHAGTPIFLLSGNLAVQGVPADADLARSIREHRLHFRPKPFSAIRLADDIQAALSPTPADDASARRTAR